MNYEKIDSTIPGPGISETDWNDVFEGCNCEAECSSAAGCSCLINKIDNYTVDGKINKSSELLIECSDQCACILLPTSCRNRVVQCGPQKKLEIFSTCEMAKGFGVRAGEQIAAGEFVCEYAGECIGEQEVERRCREFRGDDNYTLTLKEFFGGKPVKTFVDPRLRGNIGRFLNHSCEPNCEIILARLGRMIPAAGIFAKRDIVRGEELCYDYGHSAIEGENRKLCLCKSEKCRKYLPMSATPIE
ncbi:putative histone-lysine N-methyltransferase set-23 [Caenorhabditis elegans]|uniref:Probable histone-lysine N-methyltransferase set-23 n=1 Tax=Caenorhabditis elegans TaxID=6239 RepID=SET23_CAEEL|nr:putative histone-lysine N-methyltransferase set-23 [Caenorhabditis elegans]Q95Y12.1 RecName: Full=Probable histone-lysine N-methyltransferase set-23; AltName: Full=SET-domain containing protein 23 [Caenorhabditis elegans]CCD66712.1 Probable histone-lysine N-methyltransferase set-23 [Caenorhabditis elegans]|eukprot:NP_741320.1 Probable histone-lysine N-methyltransferase set-23 [Caenorhabditis elegans]